MKPFSESTRDVFGAGTKWLALALLATNAFIHCGSGATAASSDALSSTKNNAVSDCDQQVKQVTGSGQFHTADGQLRTFTFTAERHSDGTVSGEAQLVRRFGDFNLILHAEIICLTVSASCNHAWLGGIIKNSDTGGFCDGKNFEFSVEDNGEGNNDPRDRVSFAENCDTPGPEQALLYCGTSGASEPFLDATMAPVEHGNVQVHE